MPVSDKIQIIIPIYNEGAGVRKVYQNISKVDIFFDQLKFVYDIDEDTSLPYIEELTKEDARVVSEKNEFGKGVIHALKWGFSKVEPGPVFVLMGDSSDKLDIMPQMLRLWREGATIVSPSRYCKGGKQIGGPIFKKILSRLAGVSLKLFGFPTSDPTNNYKLYDGHWLASQKIESTGGFEVAIELCAKANSQGLKISELPTEWYDREEGESNFKLIEWLPKYLKWYFVALKSLFVKRG